MIAAQGVEVVEKPSHNIPLTIDEMALDYSIEVDVRQDNPVARQRDVDSIAAIFRLRSGSGKERLEKCNAILITHNKTLSDSCHRFFKRHFEEDGIRNVVQLCMTDVVFSTRLWMKLSSSYNWLPRNQIISYASANLLPNEGAKRAFLSTVQKLFEESKITEEQHMRVKHSRFTDEMIALNYRSSDEVSQAETLRTVTAIFRRERERLDQAVERGFTRGIQQSVEKIEGLKREYRFAEEDVARRVQDEIQSLEQVASGYRERLVSFDVVADLFAVVVMIAIFVFVFAGFVLGSSTLFGVTLAVSGAVVALASGVILFTFTWLGIGYAQCKLWIKNKILGAALRYVNKKKSNGPDRSAI